MEDKEMKVMEFVESLILGETARPALTETLTNTFWLDMARKINLNCSWSKGVSTHGFGSNEPLFKLI